MKKIGQRNIYGIELKEVVSKFYRIGEDIKVFILVNDIQEI